MAGPGLFVATLLSATMMTQPTVGAAQALPDSLVEQIRAGAARLVLPADSTVVPLVGSPTLPLVEVFINGRGPYRFLVDLGANVVIVWRDVATAVRGDVLADRVRADIVRFDELRLGSARFEQVTVGAYDTLDVDGVLGYNVLRYAGFTLDYPGQQLLLHRRRLPPTDGVTTFSCKVIDRLPFVGWAAPGSRCPGAEPEVGGQRNSDTSLV